MGKDEYIREMSLDFTLGKPFLTRVTMTTNVREFGPFGGEGATRFVAKGTRLLFVDGETGPLVARFTAYYDKCS